MVRLFQNLDRGFLQTDRSFPQDIALSSAPVVQGTLFTQERLEIGFVRTGVSTNEDIGVSPTITLRLKRNTGDHKYDAPTVVAVSSWTETTINSQKYYVGLLDCSAPTLQKLLGVDNAQQQEVVTLQFEGDASGSLNGRYFDLWHSTTAYVRYWFSNGSGTAPAAGTGGTLQQVTFATNDSAATVAELVRVLIEAHASWTATRSTDTVTATASAADERGWHHPRNSGATITLSAAGRGTEVTTDVASVDLLAEFAYEYDGYTQKSRPFTVRIYNSLERPGVTNPGNGATNIRRGQAAISNGASSVAVTFSTVYSSASWTLLAAYVRNTTDATPAALGVKTMTVRTAAGFTVLLDGPTDSANYVLEYVCSQ